MLNNTAIIINHWVCFPQQIKQNCLKDLDKGLVIANGVKAIIKTLKEENKTVRRRKVVI